MKGRRPSFSTGVSVSYPRKFCGKPAEGRKEMHIYEKVIDGKRYLTEIPNCVCIEKSGDEYRLLCRLQQRGENFYRCAKDAEYLRQDVGKKTLYLTGDAKTKVLEELARFDDDWEKTEFDGFDAINFLDGSIIVFIRRISNTAYVAILKYRDKVGNKSIKRINADTVDVIIRETSWIFHFYLNNKEQSDALRAAKLLHDNPFYKYALASGDELLALQIRLCYHVAGKDDCKRLGELLGLRVLPPLGKEHDRYYVIPSGEIDRGLLDDSGYGCSHVPYFAMKGSTHSLWRVNPYAKSVIDAAKTDSETISFEDFLRLFETEEENK